MMDSSDVFKFNSETYSIEGLITTLAAGGGCLGQNNSAGTGGWCWISSKLSTDDQVLWMFMSGKMWEIICYLATAFLYMMVKLIIKLQVRSQNYNHSYDYSKSSSKLHL